MVIDMNEAQVCTVDRVRQVLEGTQSLEFRRAEDDEGRYAWIESVLRRLGYRQLKRGERGVVLAYLQRLSGYSRAQVTRLVSRWVGGKRLVKKYRAPKHAFARRYTSADVALLGDVDRAMGTMSGPAVGGDPNLLFFGQREHASSPLSVFFRSASLTRLLRG